MKHFLIGLRSLQIVFIVPFLLQIVGTVGLVGYLSFKNGEKAVEDLANDLMEEVNQLIEERIQTYLSFPPLLNQIYVDGFELGHLKLNDSRHLERYFWKQMQAFDTISFTFIGTYLGDGYGVRRQPDQTLQIVIADRSTNNRGEYYTIGDRGERLTLVGTTPKYDPRERSWYKSAVAAGQPIWSPIYIDFIEEALEATAVRPIYDENNNLIAVIGNSFLVKDIDNFLRNLEIGESGMAFLIERDNNLISTSTNTPLAIKINSELERIKATESEHPLIRKVAQELEKRWPDLSKITSSQKVEIALNGSDYFVQITPLQDEYQLNWLKIIVVPKSDFMAEINANSRTTIVLCIVALFIAIIIGILTARWVIKPILYLNHKAKSVAKGNWHETVNIQRNDELGQLANSFNSMGGQLQQFFSEITQSKQEISQILESLPVGVGVHNLDGSIIYYNEAAKSLLGKGIIENVTEKELAQTYQVYVAGTHKLYPSEKMPIIQALQGKSAWADDLEIHRQDKIITLEVSAIPIKDQHDNIIKAVAVFQDITARKQSEQILNNYQQTLETEIAQRTT